MGLWWIAGELFLSLMWINTFISANSSNVNITSCYGKDCGALLGSNVENATLEKCKLINHNSFGGVNPTIKLCYIENENILTIYDEYSNNYVVTVN